MAIANLKDNQAMATLTVTDRGQVTFRKDLLRQLGIQSGQKIELDLLLECLGMHKAAKKTGTINSLIWLLQGLTKKVAFLADIGKAVPQAWAGKV